MMLGILFASQLALRRLRRRVESPLLSVDFERYLGSGRVTTLLKLG